MRTPLSTALFFLKKIRVLLLTLLQTDEVKQIIKFLSMIESQLNLVQTFVDDLLDWGQIKDGVFRMTKESFNPADSLNIILETFKPQAIQKGVGLAWHSVLEMLPSGAIARQPP